MAWLCAYYAIGFIIWIAIQCIPFNKWERECKDLDKRLRRLAKKMDIDYDGLEDYYYWKELAEKKNKNDEN